MKTRKQSFWVECIDQQKYYWEDDFKVGRVWRREPKADVERRGPIIKVMMELPAILFDHKTAVTVVDG